MSSQPDPTSHLPDIYRSYPSRPIPYNPSPGARRGVIVVFPTPLTPSDERKMQEIQGLRKEWDQAWERWLPHVTLVAPFLVPVPAQTAEVTKKEEGMEHTMRPGKREAGGLIPDNQPAASCTETERRIHEHLRHACAAFNSHTINISSINTFPLRGYTNVHLRPAEEDGYAELMSLQGACQRAIESLRGEDGKPKHRAERRREQHVTKAAQTSSTVSTVNVQQVHNGSPTATGSSSRTYTRPMYRGGEDEARCITLPTTEIAIDPIPKDGFEHAARRAATDSQNMVTPTTNQSKPSRNPISAQPANNPVRRTCDRGNNRAFIPHLSIGQARTTLSRDHLISLVRQIIGEDPVGQEPTSINCRIDRVWFLSKPIGAAGPYEVVSSIELANEDVGQ